MLKLVGITLVQIAQFASILGLYFTVQPIDVAHPLDGRPLWHWFLVFTITGFCIILIYHDIVTYLRFAPKSFKASKKINDYMRRWIHSGSRVVIFSRDLSWARESDTEALLLTKARDGELTVCIEHDIPLTSKLREAGARIIEYGELNHVPRSRFTIIDFERDGARVAVGSKIHGQHMIQEFQQGEHPYFGVAEDLVKILIAYTEANNNVSAH